MPVPPIHAATSDASLHLHRFRFCHLCFSLYYLCHFCSTSDNLNTTQTLECSKGKYNAKIIK
jgi:hypothetical protein